MVLADHVYRDAETGKFLIIGTFGNIFLRTVVAPPKPAPAGSEIEGEVQTVEATHVSQAGTPYLYLALTSIHGRVPLHLKYVNLADSSVSLECQLDVESNNPVAVAEFCLPLPPLTRPPGLYSLDLLHEGEILGSWRVAIGPPPSAEEAQP